MVRPPNRFTVTALNVKGQLKWAPAAAEVMQVIGAGSDIMAFTETWRREGDPAPEIAGFTGHSFARPRRLQKNPDGAPHGGIAIYIRDNIAKHASRGVSGIDSDPTNSLGVMSIARTAGFEKDLYLIVTYIPPRASKRTWKLLEDWVQSLSARGLVLVVGDQNARTREDADFSAADLAAVAEEDDGLIVIPTCSVRRNQDPKLNASGSKMLAMCKRTGLRIANGRVAGNEEGALTFHSVATDGGASAVDNVLACPSTFPLIMYLRVQPAAFSDHSAVSVQLALAEDSPRRSEQSQDVPAPRAQRMGGAANIKAWVEEILPGMAAKFAQLTEAAPLAAVQGSRPVAPVVPAV